jgi:hypothetical protein
LPVALLVLTLTPTLFAATEPAFIFGVGTHHPTEPEYFRELVQAGVMSTREDYSWNACEKEKGVIKVPEAFYSFINRTLENNLSTIVILDYGNQFYDEGGYPRSQEAIDGFVRYSEAVVTALKGKMKYVQIWNEWDGGCGMNGHGRGDAESYVKLIAAVYPKIKAIDPTLIVIANSVCTGDAFFKKTLDLGVLKYCDAVALHTYFYGDPLKTLENTWFPRMQNIDLMIKAANNGKSFPLYATEIGWPTQVDMRGSTEAFSADSMARLYPLAMSFPYIKGLWWYDFRDDGWNAKYNEDNFGMTRRDLTPKASYFVYQDLTRMLKGASFVERIDIKDPKVWIMKYQKANSSLIAAWSEYKDTDIQLSFTSPRALEVNTCQIGYGSLKRTFSKGSESDSVSKLDLIVRSRPWVLEGDLSDVKIAGFNKKDFPESLRPQKIEVRAPAEIGVANQVGAGKGTTYNFSDEKNYRRTFDIKRNGNSDLSASFSMRWDKDHLYLNVSVTDNQFIQNFADGETWNGDGLQMAFHALGRDAGNTGHSDFDVALTPKGSIVYRQAGLAGTTTGLEAAIKATITQKSDVTLYEVSIPVSAVGLTELKLGTAFGFSLLVNDNDAKTRKGYLCWGEGIGESKDPSLYNWILLAE